MSREEALRMDDDQGRTPQKIGSRKVFILE